MPCKSTVKSAAAIVLSVVYRNLRLAIDSKTHSSMVSLFKSVPQMFPSKLPYVNSHVASFLHSDSSLPALPQPEFVPMFARAGRPGGAHDFDTFKFEHPSIPSALPDLPTMLPELAVVENEDNDLYKQHMTIIDGWRKFLMFLPFEIPFSCHLYRNFGTVLSVKYRHSIARLWHQ